MKSVVLVLDSDPEIARKIGAANQFALYSTTKGEVEDWLERKGAVVSRVLINAHLSIPAGLPILYKVLEANPQASVWLMVDKLEPWSRSVCKKLGYQGVLTRKEVIKNLDGWLSLSDSGVALQSEAGDDADWFEEQEMLPVLPFQLEHPDALRFSLFRKLDGGGYRRIYRANEKIRFHELSELPDLSFYVVKEAVMTHLRLIQEAEQRLLENHDASWQFQLAEWVNWPVSS